MGSPHDMIADRADFFAEHMAQDNIVCAILLVLYDLQMPVNCIGFDYLEIMIPYAFHNRVMIDTNGLYESVCRQYPRADYNSVENAVTRAIQKAWKTRNGGRWHLYFPEYVLQRKKPPTNTEFIKSIMYFMDMWQDRCVKEASLCESK